VKRSGYGRWARGALPAALVLAWHLPALALADSQVYKKVAPSTVWFFEQGSATGVLVDVQKRWILTAEHVVRAALQAGRTDVKVIFAQVNGEGNVLTEKPNYGFEKKLRLAIPGKVIRSHRMKDLALIELERVPVGVKAVSLASAMPRPGDNVHVIGNSTFFHGGLFSYSFGNVRNCYFYERLQLGDCFYALAHHAPTNRGDSGGPVLNDAGELIGIISGGTTGSGEGEQVIDHSVHVQEIRNFLIPANLPVLKNFTFTGTINVPMAGDEFFFPVSLNNQVDLDLRGNGATDLDLFAYDFDAHDNKGKPIIETLVKQIGLTDQEKDSFSPKYTGVCHVMVLNLRDPKNKDFRLTAKNTYSLAIVCKNPVQGALTASRHLVAMGTDGYKVQFNDGASKVRIRIRGDGDTVLELMITDPKGKELLRQKGDPDSIRADFLVKDAGVHEVRVANRSPQQFNRYTMTID
jgi:S1-C subfamily serine protease